MTGISLGTGLVFIACPAPIREHDGTLRRT